MNQPLRERMVDPLGDEGVDRLWQRISDRRDRARTRASAARVALAGVVVAASILCFGPISRTRPASIPQSHDAATSATPARPASDEGQVASALPTLRAKSEPVTSPGAQGPVGDERSPRPQRRVRGVTEVAARRSSSGRRAPPPTPDAAESIRVGPEGRLVFVHPGF